MNNIFPSCCVIRALPVTPDGIGKMGSLTLLMKTGILLRTEDEGILAFGVVDAVCDFVETAQPLHRSKGLSGFYQNQTLNSTTQVDIF